MTNSDSRITTSLECSNVVLRHFKPRSMRVIGGPCSTFRLSSLYRAKAIVHPGQVIGLLLTEKTY